MLPTCGRGQIGCKDGKTIGVKKNMQEKNVLVVGRWSLVVREDRVRVSVGKGRFGRLPGHYFDWKMFLRFLKFRLPY